MEIYTKYSYHTLLVLKISKSGMSISDKPRSGRLLKASGDESDEKVKRVLETDNRLTLKAIPTKVLVSMSSVHKIIAVILNLSLHCSRWFQKFLP